MTSWTNDAEVERLASQVAAIYGISKTEAVRRALLHELKREGVVGSLVERGMAFTRDLHARAAAGEGQTVDKAFIDGLYK